MSDTPALGATPPILSAGGLLDASARSWFLLAVAGQWTFALYVLSFYGGSALEGDLATWAQVLPEGMIAGDGPGNVALAAHLALALIIMVGGPLQLVPGIRARAPVFHRWNGRIFLTGACTAALSGLYLVWTRGTVGNLFNHVAVSINGVLILVCAAFALRHALVRELDVHRRWALRLFLVVNGVWFFRVGLMFWLIVNGGPVGFDPKTFQGPFLDFLGVAQYAVPLAVLELYFLARDRGGHTFRLAMAGGLGVLTLMMGVGIFGATTGMWLPRI